jgi:ferredoxin
MSAVAPVVITKVRVTVNPIKCFAHGLCAELLPERVTLDEWGYPIIDGRPLNEDEYRHAVRAAKSCPTLALLLVDGR